VELVIQPICQILDLPWQLKFFHQDECFIFDFAAQAIDRYLDGQQLLHIDFAEVVDFGVEELVPEADAGDLLVNIPRPAIYYLNLAIGQGERFRIHQLTTSDAMEAAAARDWMNQLQSQLWRMVKDNILI
jgi:hypothetical protein